VLDVVWKWLALERGSVDDVGHFPTRTSLEYKVAPSFPSRPQQHRRPALGPSNAPCAQWLSTLTWFDLSLNAEQSGRGAQRLSCTSRAPRSFTKLSRHSMCELTRLRMEDQMIRDY
jgi:hypothetical protein